MCIQSVSIFCTDYALKYSIGYVATTIVSAFKQNFIWMANTKLAKWVENDKCHLIIYFLTKKCENARVFCVFIIVFRKDIFLK